MIYKCTKCNKLCWHTDFAYTYRTQTNKMYRVAQCFSCRASYGKNRRANKDVNNQPWYRATNLFPIIKYRAKRKNLAFDLDKEWLYTKFKGGICEVTGLPLNYKQTKTPGLPRAFGGSVDRKDSAQGYTKDNCQFVCWIYNRAKGVGTHKDIMLMAAALLERSSCK